MTREERENAIRCLKMWIEKEPYLQTYKTCLEALEQEPTKQREKELAEEWKCGYEMGFEEAKVFYEQEPCEDAISRNDMLDAVGHGTTYTSLEVQKIINGLPSVNPVPCDDAISRQAVLDCATLITSIPTEDWDIGDWVCLFRDRVSQLPPVRPQEQTKEKYIDVFEVANSPWIFLDNCANSGYYCAKCKKKLVKDGWSETVKKINFCPNCGAKMESEEK